MKNAITLPVNFDNGETIAVNVYNDAPNPLHYSLMIGDETAGTLKFAEDKHSWEYTGQLTEHEQQQIAGFIQNYTDQDWDN